MRCKNCGVSLPPTATTCSNCGIVVEVDYHLIKKPGSERLVRAFLEEYRLESVNGLSPEGTPALIIAVSQKEGLDLIGAMIDMGANIDSQDKYGSTALIEAAKAGIDDVISLLLERGAFTQARDDLNRDALYWSIKKGHVHIVKLLLLADADPATCYASGQTPLMMAIKNRDVVTVNALIEAGSSLDNSDFIDACDELGQTALIRAAQDGLENIVELLIRAGADIHAKDQNGRTALIAAAECGRAGVVRLLLEERAKCITELNQKNSNKSLHVRPDGSISELNLEDKDANGMTALMIAVISGHADVVRLLLEAQVNTEAKDDDGRTALILAAINYASVEVVNLLIGAGANPLTKDNNGDTALKWAEVNQLVEIAHILRARNFTNR